ncbi:MAG: DUF1993 family protein [Myxococcota bacterium]
MTLSMHSASVPLFERALTNMLSWLDKAEEHAEAKGFDVNNFVGMRLAPDMLPFNRQIHIATDAAKNAAARLAGQEPPSWPDDEETFEALRGRIQKAIDFVQSVPADQIDGSEDREVILPIGPEQSITFTGERFLTGFATPNFFFHVVMVYSLLRQGGVALGKMDYLGAP